MNLGLCIHEWLVIALALAVLLADLWVPASVRRKLGYVAALGLGAILIYSALFVRISPGEVLYAADGMFAFDGLALFFKRFFLAATILLLLLSVECATFEAIAEYYALLLFALAGMLFASSANNFALLFVSLELITVTFYVLTSFQRGRLTSLEAGVKYLIIGALSTGFTVFGIALVYGTCGTLDFSKLAAVAAQLAGNDDQRERECRRCDCESQRQKHCERECGPSGIRQEWKQSDRRAQERNDRQDHHGTARAAMALAEIDQRPPQHRPQ